MKNYEFIGLFSSIYYSRLVRCMHLVITQEDAKWIGYFFFCFCIVLNVANVDAVQMSHFVTNNILLGMQKQRNYEAKTLNIHYKQTNKKPNSETKNVLIGKYAYESSKSTRLNRTRKRMKHE